MFDIHFYENPKISKELRIIMAQIDELRSLLEQQNEVISDETAEIKTKVDALEAKIVELGGNQMPDITDILDDVRSSISKIEAISDTEVPAASGESTTGTETSPMTTGTEGTTSGTNDMGGATTGTTGTETTPTETGTTDTGMSDTGTTTGESGDQF